MAKIFTDLLISIPVGVVYNMTIHKTAEIFNSDIDYNNKVQRDLIVTFGGGMLGLIIANFVFCDTCQYKNKPIKYGLVFGTFLLFIHTLFYNWKRLANDTKYVIMLLTLVALIWYIYINFTDKENTPKKKKKKHTKLDNESKYLPATYVNYDPEPFYNDDDNNNIINY